MRRRDAKEPYDSARAKRYASRVGKLIFVVPSSRVDCAYAIGMCARCLTFPTDEMEACVDRITVYLAQNESVGVNYSADAVKPELHAYSDSDWQVTHSTTGFAVMLAGAAVSYSSKRQQSIALSSTEAEIMAASQCACEVMFIRNLYGEMGGDISKPTVIYVDNSGAVQLARDRRSCQRSRHIQRRFLKLREW